MRYVWNFTKPAQARCMGHFFVLRDVNSAVAEDLSGVSPGNYKIVFGGSYNEYLEVGQLFRSLSRMDYELYTFCEGDVLVIAGQEMAYAYMMRSMNAVTLEKSFVKEFSEQFERVYLKWGNRNVAFSIVRMDNDSPNCIDGYSLEVYDEKDRVLCTDYYEATSNNCFVLLNEAMLGLKELAFDTSLHKFVYKTASMDDKTTYVPDIPEVNFCSTDNSFIARSNAIFRKEHEEIQLVMSHRQKMEEQCKNDLVTPDIMEQVAFIHVKDILEKHADEFIEIRNVIFHEYDETCKDDARIAKVVVEYDSNMTEMYLHDLFCMDSCVCTRGSEKVYIEIIPIRRKETGAFAEYLSGTKNAGFKKMLEEKGIDLYFKGEHGYVLMPGKKDIENEEALLPVYDKDGNILGSVKVHVYEEDDLPFAEPPLLFAELGEGALTPEQRYRLIELFDIRYKQTQYGYENEFPVVVSMMVDKGAVLINSQYLRNEELAERVRNIIWPDKVTDSEFWIGAVEHESGKILEVHSLEEAKRNDYHADLYFSEDVVTRQDKCKVSYFWIEEGRVQLDWETEFNDEAGSKFLCERINSQLEIVSDSAAILKGGTTA